MTLIWEKNLIPLLSAAPAAAPATAPDAAPAAAPAAASVTL